MFLAAINQHQQIIYLTFTGHVTAAQLQRPAEEIESLFAEMRAGFRVLADLTHLNTMDAECAGGVGKLMEECDKRLVGMIVRVIPDPSKDIGFNLLSRFHYHQSRPRTVTCETMEEAARALSL